MANKNPNLENLKKGKKTEFNSSSGELAAIEGQKGGLKKAENGKIKKDFQSKLAYAIEMTTKKAIKESDKQDIKDILGESGIIIYNLVQMAMNSKNPATKLGAIKEIIDRTEGRVKQEVGYTHKEIEFDEEDEADMKEALMEKYNLMEKTN